MEYIYRMATPDDYPALVKFWCEHSGWDIIDQETWEKRFLTSPNGPTEMSLAINEETGEIIGQVFFIPCKIAVGDKEILGYRPATIVMANNLRKQWISKLQEIIVNIYMQAVSALLEKGASLFQSVAHQRWLGLFRSSHMSTEGWGSLRSKFPFFQQAEFPLYSLKLPVDESIDLRGDYEIENLSYDDARVDELWQKARTLYKAMVSRDSKSLAWKNSHRAYQLKGVSIGGRLIGLFVWIAKPKDKQILICDMLTGDADNSLIITLKAAILTAHQYVKTSDEMDNKIEKVAILATPLLKPHLENLGFQKDDYIFPLLVHLFNPDFSQEEVAPADWYLSAND